MSVQRIAVITLLLALVVQVQPVVSVDSSARELYSVDIATAGAPTLGALTTDAEIAWWVELGDVLVVSGTAASRDRASRLARVTPLPALRTGEQLYFGSRLHRNEIEDHGFDAQGVRLLASSGVHSIVAAPPAAAAAINEHGHGRLTPLEPNLVLARSVANEPDGPVHAFKGDAGQAFADAVDGARWRETVRDLADIQTRYTGSPGASTARDYIAAELEAAGLDVTIDPFQTGSLPSFNVIGEIVGSERPNDVYLVTAHYDSISERATDLAPGAEDNGSGTAGVIELARVFGSSNPAATIRFIAFSGEEEGLFGSEDYSAGLVSSGEAQNVKGVINMDMIGYSGDDDLDVLLETGAIGSDLLEVLQASAAAVTDLRVVTSFTPFGSDHVPFLRRGIPAVLTIENDWATYPGYHRTTDTIEKVRVDMGREILRMNAAALAQLTGSDGSEANLSLTDPNVKTKVFGGFLTTIRWVTTADDVESFELQYSVDGGTNFLPIVTGIAADLRSFDWLVPEALQANKGRLRVVAHRDNGTTIVDASDVNLKFRASSGPFIKKVKYKGGATEQLVVKGRFALTYSQITVDGVALDATVSESRYFDGESTKRLFGRDDVLDELVPPGQTVTVRVVDIRNGQTTAEFLYTR